MNKAEQILKQITPEVVEKEVERIKKVKLPPKLEKCVEEYEKVGDRDRFLWKGLYAFAPYGSLPGVMDEYWQSVLETKIISMIFVTLADDLVDKHRNKKLFNEISGIPFNTDFKIDKKLPLNQQGYLENAWRIWNVLEKEIKKYPHYEEFEELLKFDYQQVLNSLKFGYLLNKNLYLLNYSECKTYLPYNMQVFVNCDFDIMCLSGFDIKELGVLREIISRSQIMARIANCLSTWERELEENDFSSFVFVYAVKNGIVNTRELKKRNKDEIRRKIKLSDCQEYLLDEWNKSYDEIRNLTKKIKSVNISQYLKGSETILSIYIINKGLV